MRDLDDSGRELTGEIKALHSRIAKLEQTSHNLLKPENTDEELDRAWREWEATFDATKDVIFLTDNEFRIVQANLATSQLFDRPLDRIVGMNCWQLVHGATRPPKDCPLEKAKITKKHEEIELYLPEKNVWVIASVDPVFDQQGNLTGAVHIIRDITQRKRAEESLRESEQKFRTIFDNTSDGMFLFDLEAKKFSVCNKAWLKMLGYTQEEFMNLAIEDLHPKEDLPFIYLQIEEFAKGGKGIRNDIRFKRKDRSIFFTDLSPDLITLGGKRHILIDIKDITERRRSEELLRKERDRAQKYLDIAGVMLVAIDSEQRVGLINKKGCEILGYSEEEIIAKNWFDNFLPEKIREEVRAVFEKIISGEIDSLEYYENPILTKNGEERLIAWHNTALMDDKGKVIAALGSGEDITERKKAEEALRESEDRLRLAQVSANVGIWDWNVQTGQLAWTEELESLYGYIPGTFPGNYTGFSDRVHPDDLVYVEARRDEAVATHRPFDFDFRILLPSGIVRWVNCKGAAKYDETGAPLRVFGVNIDITERKKAEEETKKFKTISDKAGYGVAISDIEGNLLYCNNSFAEMHGYTADELVGKNLSIFHNKEQMKIVERLKEKLRQEGSYVAEEVWHKRKDDTIFLSLMNGTLIKDENGEPLFMAATAIDITEHKKAEEALRESEEKYRDLFENAREAIVTLDLKGNITGVNKLVEEYGFKRKELIGKSSFDFSTEKYRSKSVKEFEDLVRGVPVEGKVEVITPKGNVIAEYKSNPIRRGGQIVGAQSILTDVTERKKAEEALKESEKKYRTLIENVPQKIFLKDKDSVYVSCNENYAQDLKIKPEEITGKTDYDFYTKELAEKYRADDRKNMESGKVEDIEEKYIQGGKEFWVHTVKTPVKDDKGNIIGVLGIFRNITEQKIAKQKLIEDQVKLKSLASQLTLAEERERRRIAGELHDRISQSLAISKIKLEALRKSGYGEKLDKTLEEICNSIGQTIQDTRTLTFDIGNPILYELGFETAVSHWLTEQIQNKHKIKTEFEDDGQVKNLDDDIRVLLFRSVQELLINIVKHAQASKVKVSIRKADNHICVEVEDNGIGFEVEKSAHVPAKTYGFGLFSIRHRLEDLDGHLEIESKPGRGCKVTMTAPLKRKETADGRNRATN